MDSGPIERLEDFPEFKVLKVLHPKRYGWTCRASVDGELLVVKQRSVYYKDPYSKEPSEPYILAHILRAHGRPHDHIVQYVGEYGLYKNTLTLNFPFYEGGNLEQVIRTYGFHFRERFLWQVLTQMASALAFLHKGVVAKDGKIESTHRDWLSVIHGNIKPSKVFLREKYRSGDEDPHLILGGFNLAFMGVEGESDWGSPEWQGPEHPVICAKTDVWGLGSIIHAMTLGLSPTVAKPSKVKMKPEEWEKRWESKRPLRMPDHYSRELDDCMRECLVLDRKIRIDSKKLIRLVAEGLFEYEEGIQATKIEGERSHRNRRSDGRGHGMETGKDGRRERKRQQPETRGRNRDRDQGYY